jgi:hypothetical protein
MRSVTNSPVSSIQLSRLQARKRCCFGASCHSANMSEWHETARSGARLCSPLKTEGDATALRPLGEDTLVNMSVWRDVASLRNYVYRSV